MQAIQTFHHRNNNAAVQKLRTKHRENGMRAVQIWVPDTRRAEFVAECRRQAHNVASHAAYENEVMDWVEFVADEQGWQA